MCAGLGAETLGRWLLAKHSNVADTMGAHMMRGMCSYLQQSLNIDVDKSRGYEVLRLDLTTCRSWLSRGRGAKSADKKTTSSPQKHRLHHMDTSDTQSRGRVSVNRGRGG